MFVCAGSVSDSAGNLLYSDPTNPNSFTLLSNNGQYSGVIALPSRAHSALPSLLYSITSRILQCRYHHVALRAAFRLVLPGLYCKSCTVHPDSWTAVRQILCNKSQP